MIDHTEYMQSIVDFDLPLIKNSTIMSEKFIYRKNLAEKYLRDQTKDMKNTTLKHFMVVNDQIKSYFLLI